MAHSGIGLWISLKNSSTICLYHTETFKHLQDINIASNIARVPGNRECIGEGRVTVTALMACKGLLWVGTNVGISLTIPLPRLEGVPIISGRVNMSYHAHFGPISFLLALQPRSSNFKPHIPDAEPVVEVVEPSTDSPCAKNTDIASKLRQLSPIVVRRRRSREAEIPFRGAKTLPRGLGCGGGFLSSSTTSSTSGDTCDVYGLYGELMYCREYESEGGTSGGGGVPGGPEYESLRRSDPELAAIPGKVSTLDRRLRIKAGRPRSLDLSSWSVDSHASSVCTSSGSEDPIHSIQTPVDSPIPEKPPPPPDPAASSRRTIVTLMGGRGYVNWRHQMGSKNSSEPNSNDAHIVIWEMKL